MLFQDYARVPVPQEKTTSGWHIGLVEIGVGLTLPAFLIGTTVGANLGFMQGMAAVALAGFILALVGVFTGWIGGSVRLSTYYIAQLVFGRYGAYFVNLILAVIMFGWFGVTVSMFAQAVHTTFPILTTTQWSLAGGGLMIATAIWGFRGLAYLTWFAVPAIFMALLWTATQTLNLQGAEAVFSFSGVGEMSFGAVVSMLVGAWMAGVCVLPDTARYAKTPGHGSGAAVLCFFFGLLAIMGLSIIPALATGEADIVKTMLALGFPLITTVIIVLASWSSNDNNLYSASLSLASMVPNIVKWKITLIAGVVGTLFGIAGIMNHYITFLIFLGIFLPPLVGVYVVSFFMQREKFSYKNLETVRKFNWWALVAWGLGSLLAYFTSDAGSGGAGLFSITTVPALDGLLCAAICMAGVVVLFPIKNRKI
jgi:cytosine permease